MYSTTYWWFVFQFHECPYQHNKFRNIQLIDINELTNKNCAEIPTQFSENLAEYLSDITPLTI